MKHIIFDCDGTLLDTSGPQYRLFPGIKELLLELSKDHTLYVWTARGRQSTLRILEELKVSQYFQSFATIDDALPKPNIDGILALVGDAPKNAVCVIGDSSNDMLGAKNFGAVSIGCVWNRQACPITLKDTGADFIVNHPSECSKLIQQNVKGE